MPYGIAEKKSDVYTSISQKKKRESTASDPLGRPSPTRDDDGVLFSTQQQRSFSQTVCIYIYLIGGQQSKS